MDLRPRPVVAAAGDFRREPARLEQGALELVSFPLVTAIAQRYGSCVAETAPHVASAAPIEDVAGRRPDRGRAGEGAACRPSTGSVGGMLALQRLAGNRRVVNLVVDATAPEPAGGAEFTVQRIRTHDYRDDRIRQLALGNNAELQVAQASLAPAPLQYQLAAGEVERSLNQMQSVRTAVRQALTSAGIGGNLIQVLGQEYTIGVGTHRIAVWSADGTQRLFQIELAVFPHGGQLLDAQQADAAWSANIVGAMTYEQAVSRPFRLVHTCEPLDPHNRELVLAKVAISRQKASTLIQLTPQAIADLITEVRTRTQNNEYTAAHHFTTVATYPMLDIDPATNPATLKTFDACFEYDVFHNPDLKLWQISHFHGPQNIVNLQLIGPATRGITAAISKTAQALTFVAPTNGQHVPEGQAFDIRLQQARALDLVRVQIDAGDWKPCELDPGNPGQWVLHAVGQQAGVHTIRVEGQEQKGRRTKMLTRTVNVP